MLVKEFCEAFEDKTVLLKVIVNLDNKTLDSNDKYNPYNNYVGHIENICTLYRDYQIDKISIEETILNGKNTKINTLTISKQDTIKQLAQSISKSNTLISEFEALCKPIQKWLLENYNPMYSVIIESDFAKVVSNEIGVPFNKES